MKLRKLQILGSQYSRKVNWISNIAGRMESKGLACKSRLGDDSNGGASRAMRSTTMQGIIPGGVHE